MTSWWLWGQICPNSKEQHSRTARLFSLSVWGRGMRQRTLDPATRTLLQVRVGDVEEAGQVFSTLMGDVVEPRRDFIVGNALKVANLDV